MTFTNTPLQDARLRETWGADGIPPQACAAHWYALHTASSQEHVVSQKLSAAGIESFYPFRLETSADKRRSYEKKFLPGYVFGKFAIDDDTAVVAISQVIRIVGAGRHAIVIPDVEIEQVKLITKLPDAAPCDFLAVGDRVRVRYGFLVGLEGFVVRSATKKKTWVVVSVQSLERSLKAEVDPLSLEFIGHAQAA